MHRPKLYTKVNNVQRRDAEYFTEEYSEEIGRMSGRCIDVGTGPGDVMIDFILPKLEPNSTVTCSDISETMVTNAEESYGHNNRLSFIKMDIESPDLPKDLLGQFDHVTSLYCLHWCRELRQAFENIYKLLRPGGTAFITFLASTPILDAFTVLGAIPKYEIYLKEAHRVIPHFQHVKWPRQFVRTLFTDTGFEVQSCSCRPMTYVFDTIEQLKAFLLALSPREIEQMSTDLHSEYMEDLVTEALKHEIIFNKDCNGQNESSILARYRAFVIYCKKPSAN